jgi:hypothetical protein
MKVFVIFIYASLTLALPAKNAGKKLVKSDKNVNPSGKKSQLSDVNSKNVPNGKSSVRNGKIF